MPGTPVTLTPATPPPPKGCELLRENVYESARLADVDEVRLRRKPTMTHREDQLVAPLTSEVKKYTVVLDLDETVVYAREGPLYARAYLRELLRSIKDDFEVIVWTAGEREYAKNILEEINEDCIIQHLIYRHKTWFSTDDYTKDLKKLGRDINYVIIVENTPDCVRANPKNSIIVEDFEVPGTPTPSQEKEMNLQDSESTVGPITPSSTVMKPKRQFTDRTLLLLQEVLLDLSASGESVPEFLSRCPLLTQQVILGSDGKGIPTYFLGKRRKRGAPPSTSMTPLLKRIPRPEGRKRTDTTPMRSRKEKTALAEQDPPED
ncbi:nuclear lim interactor-interacting factor [Trypanosoma theileri]|uniref:Mitochondrial import inner membrane translocase subunit TIM50 n=1 Tax=Trypanosoma theileri TaxID=67003 RepID=A0A1X0P5T3_9TRYP|nr:nuclear lim interactor-interacting factor [Trypanosoma theileri]ORC92208.1 nuclear lim interactor-interacting factor [Trypanosoma theileri]